MTCEIDGYGVSTSVAGGRPRAEALEAIAAAGFHTVELLGDAAHLDRWTTDPAGLRRDLERLGLAARSVHLVSAAWGIANPDTALRENAIQAGLGSMREAAAVGAEVVICHPNGLAPDYADYTPADRAASLARTRAALELFAREAARLGVRLALENLPSRNTRRPATTMGEVLRLIEGLGNHVGLCQDVGHTNANRLDAVEDFRAAEGRVLALHLQDNDGLGEDQHLLPGEGTTGWPAYVDALRAAGYGGLRTFEVKTAEDLPATLATLARLASSWGGR